MPKPVPSPQISKQITAYLTALALCLLSSAAAASSVTVKAVEGSQVLLDWSSVGKTDETGTLVLPNVSEGEHTLMIRHPQRRAQTQKFTFSQTAPLLIQFEEAALLTPTPLNERNFLEDEVELQWVSSMGWGLLGAFALFVTVIVASAVVVGRVSQPG